MAFSKDGSLIAGGFGDSTVKLWDLQKDNSKWAMAQKEYYGTDGRDPQYAETSNEFSELIAHSQPVYSVAFSPDNECLLSSSGDGSIRLWSTRTKTNLVAYKGHNYPIWQVKFSPFGLYFASASHDKTARLWSTTQIAPLRIFVGHSQDVNVSFEACSKLTQVR